MFESPEQLVLGLVTGIAFGFLLQKGRVTKYEVIVGQLLLKDWTAFKIMATAMLVGAIGVYALRAAEITYLDIWPLQPASMLLGAAFFGVGIAILGYCPGTGMAGAGEGNRDAAVGVLGMLAGAAVFVAAYPFLQSLGLSLGDWGKVTIPGLLGISPWIVIGALAFTVAFAFVLRARWTSPHSPSPG